MPATLLESNPLVEENRNQVAIKRGPVVYCLESADLPQQNIFNVLIPASINLKAEPLKIGKTFLIALTGEARLLESDTWKDTLYRKVNLTDEACQNKNSSHIMPGQQGQDRHDRLDAFNEMIKVESAE